MTLKMKTLPARYQIKPNIFVTCSLEIEDHNEQEVRLFAGIKRRADTVLPIGTRLYLNAPAVRDCLGEKKLGMGEFETISVQVRSHQVYEGHKDTVHICTPLKRQVHPERRKQPRERCRFPVTGSNGMKYQVFDGHTKGLGLIFASSHAVTAMNLGQRYEFAAQHKGQEFRFPGRVCHIQYNWETFEHQVGVELEELSPQQQTVLRILINPDHQTELGGTAVDAASGRIKGG